MAPVPQERRTWTRWNFAALWVGMAVCIPTYMLAASLIGAGMRWWQAVATVFVANTIVLVPMVLNAHAGAKYGIPFPILARAAFGLRGSNVPALMRALVACGWFGIQTWIGGAAVYAMAKIMAPGLVGGLDGLGMPLGLTVGQWTAFLLFWLANMVFVWIGTESIKWLETLSAPFLLLIGIGMLLWAFSAAGGVGPVLEASSQMTQEHRFWSIFAPQLTAMVGFWATLSLNISDFSRFARSQRDQIEGQAMGLPTTMTLYSCIGVLVTAATVVLYGEAIWDPVALIERFGSPGLAFFALFCLAVATISTNIAANIVSPANDFSNLAPRFISFKIGGTIAGILGILIMPWKLISNLGDYIFTWLIGYSALLGPVAGILICDYFLIRRRVLPVEDLYRDGGSVPNFNWRAIGALFIGILPNVPGFLQAATNGAVKVPAFFNVLYTYAWFVGFAVAFGVYWALSAGQQERAIYHGGTETRR